MAEVAVELDHFVQLVSKAVLVIGDNALDSALEMRLNKELPPNGEYFQDLLGVCQFGIAAGWMCPRIAGGIRFGRIVKPGGPLGRFSVDVVEMKDVVGPSHSHPNGEVDMIMPLDPNAKFDDQSAGWMVYPPGSRHAPTVTQGKALILYLLPEGAIDFNSEPNR